MRWSRMAVLLLAIGLTVLAAGICEGDDPLWRRASGRLMPGQWLTEVAKLTASDAAPSDHFSGLYAGQAIDGDTAVIGAPEDNNAAGVDAGSAYLFTYSDGSWTEQEKFIGSDTAADDRFGGSVGVFGNTIFVASIWDDHSAHVNVGSVYVFDHGPSGVVEQQKLTPSAPTDDDWFGWSLAVEGPTLVVGSASWDASDETGSAHVFTRTLDTWSLQQDLTATDGAPGDLFGHYAAISGDLLVIGAPGAEISELSHVGAAYVFTRSGNTWSEDQKIVASDGAQGDEFGISVALSNNTLLVGAKFGDSPTQQNTGAAYVFELIGDTWVEQKKISPSDGAANNLFGDTVVLDGDLAIVSAVEHDPSGHSNAGAVYVFMRTGDTWFEREKCVTSDAAPDDLFGWGPPISGHTLLAGAPGDDHPGGADAGSVYVFEVATFLDGFESGDTTAWSVTVS